MGKNDFSSFIKDNKENVKEYFETRYEIYRLKTIRTISKTAGMLGWIIISTFLLFLIILFAGITLGYWLSNIFNSLVLGFGVTSLFFVVLFICLAVFRKRLFINPVVTAIINQSADNLEND
jgi:ABC-type transport system involved in multi-copper enzyme maturation permease subunit